MKNILILMALLINDTTEAKPRQFNSRSLIDKDAEEGLKMAFASSLMIQSLNAEGMSTGSGNLINYKKEMYVITAYHVVKDSLFLTLVEKDGNTVPASILYSDDKKDIAILVPHGGFNSTEAAMHKKRRHDLLGTQVYHCGHPVGTYFNISEGIITSFAGDGFIVNSFSLPGSSGSMVFDKAGNIVGVVVSVAMYGTFGTPELASGLVKVSALNMEDVAILNR